jgi:valyl-tRNA synthetase
MAMVDEESEVAGNLITDAASTVRGFKSDAGMALNADLDKVEIYPDQTPERALDTYDLSEAVNAPVHVREGEPNVELVPVEVDPDHSVIGPEFRDQAGEVIAALESMDPSEVKAQKATGEIEIDLGSEVVVLDGDAVDITEEHRAESGAEVAVLDGELSTVIVYL